MSDSPPQAAAATRPPRRAAKPAASRKQPAGAAAERIRAVLGGADSFALVNDDCLSVLRQLPDGCIDCVVTSPPYFQQREYDVKDERQSLGIGNERKLAEYVDKLAAVFGEVRRTLAPGGSLWLNLGDKYVDKELLGVPWRVAFALKDAGWILRDDIIWHQRKGTQSVKDRMRDAYEHIFHFVKSKRYYFNADAIRIKPKKDASYVKGTITSATGVSGRKYRELIRTSAHLNPDEQAAAEAALDAVLAEMRAGEIVDFRMTIRGRQRSYHSENTTISGRAKELETRGFFFLKMRSKGFLPSNIWDIVPEDKWRNDTHCAVFPEELLEIPIKATCPPGGIVLDPFVGTGTAVSAALAHGCRGIGIDLSQEYLAVAAKRLGQRGLF